MNRFEKFIYNAVKKFPFLKSFIRNLYQRVFLFLTPPRDKQSSPYEIALKKGYFFGFHDKVPWSPDNSRILAHKIGNQKTSKCLGELEVGYFDENLMEFTSIASTQAWNWQQGSMLQWVDDQRIIFNHWNGRKNVAKLINLEDDSSKELDRPISIVSRCGTFALSFSFDRLGIGMPGYGYQNRDDHSAFDLEPEDNGMHLYNFNKNSS